MARTVAYSGNNLALPQMCVCCLDPVTPKEILLISTKDKILSINTMANKTGYLAVPCCSRCKKHITKVFNSGVGCFYMIWFLVALFGLAFLLDKNMGVAHVTPGTFGILVLVIGIILPVIFWFGYHKSRRRAKGRNLMKATCASLGPPVQLNFGAITFASDHYAEAFLRANHNVDL
jgi:hypothetical protein